jgi:AraC family transcriptional regulator
MEKEEKIPVLGMQRYLKARLMDDVSMGELARAASYSPWHSFRIFKELVGIPPATYLRRLRLSESPLELRDSKAKIVDVAYRYGYSSVDGYQRSFKKEFGVNPKEYAKNPSPILLFIPYEIMVPKERKKNMKTKNIFISIINKPERLLIYKPGKEGLDDYWDYSNDVGCDLWGILKSMKCLGNEPVCLYLPKNRIPKGCSSYIQGVEEPLNYKGEIPEGFASMKLPEGSFLLFQGEPYPEEDFEEAIVSLKKAMDSHDPQPLGYRYAKDGLRIQLEPVGQRGYIELIAIEKIA